ncbi:hypothetical protein PR048_031708 [Dryococelus australis]|uniref:Uncharacterized protein n=1 Tax=Dryococelus australis TaxID=614101 RepID=A0ABQ9G621_9NEOP|nr:hypothetical protein PR048_031708 [Dryococelus australis]
MTTDWLKFIFKNPKPWKIYKKKKHLQAKKKIFSRENKNEALIKPDQENQKENSIFRRFSLQQLKCDNNKILNIQLSTTGQRHFMVWKLEKTKRLTASFFGKICRMRATTPCSQNLSYIPPSMATSRLDMELRIEPNEIAQLGQEFG